MESVISIYTWLFGSDWSAEAVFEMNLKLVVFETPKS
jgi:hypothetical protein